MVYSVAIVPRREYVAAPLTLEYKTESGDPFTLTMSPITRETPADTLGEATDLLQKVEEFLDKKVGTKEIHLKN